jgi:hypothetical protein
MKKEFFYLGGAVALGHFFGSDFEIASSLVFGAIVGVAAFIISKFVEQYGK